MILAAGVVLGLIASIEADVRWLFGPRSNKMSVKEITRLQHIIWTGNEWRDAADGFR